MTHLIDPRLSEAKHGLARIPTIVAYHHNLFDPHTARFRIHKQVRVHERTGR